MALRIPRQHYKFIENLRYEELIAQREEIVEKMKRKYGVDPTKPGSMLKMPDPSLPPEQQMEMLSGGPAAQSAAKLPGGPPDPIAMQKSTSKFDLAPRYQKDFSV